MKKAFAALFSLWLAAGLCGCAASRGHNRGQEALALLTRAPVEQGGVRGVGAFRLTRGGTTVSGRLAFAAQQPESFRVELLSPFGMPLVSMAGNGDTLGVYSRPDRDFTSAPPGAAVLKKALGILISPAALTSLLCGRVPVVDASRTRLLEDPDGGGQVLVIEDAWGVIRERLWLSPDLSRAERAEIFSPFGKKEYEVWLSHPKDKPAEVLLRGPDGTGLSLAPDRLMTGQEIAPDTFVLERPKTP